MRCKFSHFRKTAPPATASSVRDVSTGVRCAMPRKRSAAARTELSDGAGTGKLRETQLRIPFLGQAHAPTGFEERNGRTVPIFEQLRARGQLRALYRFA